MNIGAKVQYVREQTQTRDHHCHWPGCTRQVKPAVWGCTPHWYALPTELRRKIWASFRPGQEVSATPSEAYILAAKEVQEWIAARAATTAPARPATRAAPVKPSDTPSTQQALF